MSARDRQPMGAMDGFVVGLGVIAAVLSVLLHHWHSAFQDAVFVFVFASWSSARRRVDWLEGRR